MARSGFDPSVYDSSVVGSFTPGAVYTYDGGEYVYAKLSDTTGTVNAANGHVVCWSDISTTEASVSLDVSDANHRGMPAGVAKGTVTNGNYGFFQVRGIHSAVQATVAVTDGAQVVPDTNTANDGDAIDVTGGTDDRFVLGTALSAGAGPGTFACMIHLS